LRKGELWCAQFGNKLANQGAGFARLIPRVDCFRMMVLFLVVVLHAWNALNRDSLRSLQSNLSSVCGLSARVVCYAKLSVCCRLIEQRDEVLRNFESGCDFLFCFYCVINWLRAISVTGVLAFSVVLVLGECPHDVKSKLRGNCVSLTC